MTDIHRLADYFSNANRIVTEAERPTFIKRLIEQGEWAVTCGLADGPVMLDGDYGHSLRCATYRTRLIVGPANLRKHYDLPVITHS
ncbi:hypothetical protein MELE44368_12370 [Mycolicibacterium elephantis DSM 44368]|uniref:Uncharacterized protein n=2 Tax=Mycolicibacterium elephantis TaxID=81858 RepID=A0A439DYC7_9MYCO|nr:hypothetical protein MELE44368_12370 [Mycolicibacterium elephantis DSM 44368]